MRCWQFGLFLLFSLVSLDVWAQDLPDIERLLEGNDILNTEDGYEEMVDILSNLLMTPVNVNTAGFDSLKMLFLLSDSQIDQLLERNTGIFFISTSYCWCRELGRKIWRISGLSLL